MGPEPDVLPRAAPRGPTPDAVTRLTCRRSCVGGAGGNGVGAQLMQLCHTSPSSVPGMEEARRVLERLERIGTLERASADPSELLAELRALLEEAEAWARREGGDACEASVARLRSAVERDMIAV